MPLQVPPPDSYEEEFRKALSYLNSFHSLDQCESKVVNLFSRVYVPAHTIVLKPGQIATNVCFLEKGVVRNYVLKDGKEERSWIQHEPVLIRSLLSFYTQTPSDEYVETLEPSILAMMNHDAAYQAAYDYHDFAICLFKLIANSQVRREQMYSLIKISDAESRVRKLISLDPMLFERVSNKIMAAFLEMTPETLSRILNKKEFKNMLENKY